MTLATEAPELPVSVKRNADLFEIGFAFFLLPVIVATMDHPPFFVAGKILLWMGTWFLLRRLPEEARSRALSGAASLRKPLVAISVLLALVATGAVLAQFSGLARFQALIPTQRWLSGALMLPAFAVVTSLPLSVLVWGYLPVRFEASVWLPSVLVRFLPLLAFAGLHLATFGWVAPGFALVAGGVYWVAFKGRVPVIPAILVHAVVGWMGVVGGIW